MSPCTLYLFGETQSFILLFDPLNHFFFLNHFKTLRHCPESVCLRFLAWLHLFEHPVILLWNSHSLCIWALIVGTKLRGSQVPLIYFQLSKIDKEVKAEIG